MVITECVRIELRYIYSSCYYHHQIGSINLSHCYHIFPWSCVGDVCYIISCHVLHIHFEKTGILFSSLLCSLWLVQIVGYVMTCRSHSLVCTLYHLSIIIVQTYLWRSKLWNVFQIYFVECVSNIQHIVLVIHYSIYGAVCFQFTQSLVMVERIYCFVSLSSSNRKYETIINCLGLDHETMECAVCLFIFLYILGPISYIAPVPRLYMKCNRKLVAPNPLTSWVTSPIGFPSRWSISLTILPRHFSYHIGIFWDSFY